MPAQVPTQARYTHLFTDIEKGRIQIPQFQREFVWSRKKSAGLIDSILKGYPVGAFIFWKTQERMRSVRSLGGFELPNAPDGDIISLVLDGQQRLTSLFAAINGLTVRRTDGTQTDFSEIYVDLQAQEGTPIVSDEFEIDGTARYIRLDSLIRSDPEDIIPYPKDMRSLIAQYRDNLTGFQFPIIELKDAPIEVATEVFERVNVGGKRLSVFEIMVAKTYDENQEFDLAQKADDLLGQLADVGFGTVNTSAILQLVSVIENGAAAGKEILNIKKQSFIDTYPIAEKAIREAVDYFRDALRIPASRLLPYTALTVPFAYFFARNKFRRPNLRQAGALKKLFWMTSLGERYSAAAETRLEQDIGRVDRILLGQVPEYDWTVDTGTKALLERGKFRIGSAYTRAILCLFAEQRPLELDNNFEVRLSNDFLAQSNSRNFHHFFPKKHLERAGRGDDPNHVMNITFIRDWQNKRDIRDRAPSDYVSDFAGRNNAFVAALTSHLIGDPTEFGLMDDDYATFLKARAKRVRDELRIQLK